MAAFGGRLGLGLLAEGRRFDSPLQESWFMDIPRFRSCGLWTVFCDCAPLRTVTETLKMSGVSADGPTR